MPREWVVTPIAETTEDGATATYPKYAPHDGDVSASGAIVDFSADKYSDLPWHPNTMYVTRFVADTQSAIDAVTQHDDAYGKQEYDVSDSEVADYLNQKYNDDRSFTEWLNVFNITTQ